MAKTKKEIILELKQANPNLTPEEAAAQVPCTLAYAKRILDAEKIVDNGEINTIGREIGILPEEISAWHNWIVESLHAEAAAKAFRAHQIHKKYTEK